MEEKQIHERQQLAKRHLKDAFFLQRHQVRDQSCLFVLEGIRTILKNNVPSQMLIRHDKELEQMKRMNVRKEEAVVKRQSTEKRALPKRIRTEMKAREMMFRESMRINMANSPDPEAERNRFKKVSYSLRRRIGKPRKRAITRRFTLQFQENEKKRYKAETLRFEMKHQRQLEELRIASDTAIKELEQLQNEKSTRSRKTSV